jgi:hypothetical protein
MAVLRLHGCRPTAATGAAQNRLSGAHSHLQNRDQRERDSLWPFFNIQATTSEEVPFYPSPERLKFGRNKNGPVTIGISTSGEILALMYLMYLALAGHAWAGVTGRDRPESPFTDRENM